MSSSGMVGAQLIEDVATWGVTAAYKLRRLFKMGLPELAGRSRQETFKWLERAGVVGTPNGRPETILRQMASEAALADIDARVSQDDRREPAGLCPSRFFEGAVAQAPALFAEKMPGTRDQLVAAAEAISERRFDLLGYRGLSFGDPVDWHLDPISGRRTPLLHWSLLNPLDPAVVGDSKVVWELNRHQWLVRLGQAYRLTEDEGYADIFARSVREWMLANPPGMGINWASSLEVALRLISWCWTLYLFRGSKALSPEFFFQLLDGIWVHASHVERYLSYHFSPNTHLTGEALGLFYAGVVFPESRRARRWRALGARILVAESERQVLPDGVYFEQSTCYQRYTVETYLHFLILAARNGVAISTAVIDRVQRMMDFLLAIRGPDGSIPEIGDADGGWLLPLASRPPDDFRGVFSTAAAFLGRSDCAWAAGDHPAPETFWLMGAPGLRAFEALRPAPPTMAPSRLFADGGYAVMRSGWEADAHDLIFDVGPLGCPISGGHGHADLLGIQCFVFGEPYLVDPGTYCYRADSDWRDFFRSTAAHSTVVIDGVGQAPPAGPFAWQTRPRAKLIRWRSTKVLDVAEAFHDAYCRLSDPVVHRRRVLFVKKRYWLVVDDLEGTQEHRVDVRFQFAPMEVTVDPSLWARARGHRGRGLLIRAFAAVPLKAEIHEGEVAPIQGWVSPHYGQRRPAPVLTYSNLTRLPLRIITLLLPVENVLADPPAVSPVLGEGQELVALVFSNGHDSISLW